MKTNIYFVLFTLSLFGQSENATLTIYKDGTALIKQPASWSIPSGYSTINWKNLPKVYLCGVQWQLGHACERYRLC